MALVTLRAGTWREPLYLPLLDSPEALLWLAWRLRAAVPHFDGTAQGPPRRLAGKEVARRYAVGFKACAQEMTERAPSPPSVN